MIPALAPLFSQQRTALAAHAARLSCDPAHYRAARPVADLLHDDALLDALMQRYSAHWRSDDVRAVVSAWNLDYLGALLIPAVAAASLLQLQLPLALEQVRFIAADNGAVARLCLPHAGHGIAHATPLQRYDTLVWQHLAPLHARLAQHFKASPRILWGNALRRMRAVLILPADALPGMAAGAGTSVTADRQLLLGSATWPDGRVNPLHHKRDRPAGDPDYLHRNCCLYYRLPDEGYCGACPLHPDKQGKS